MSIFFTSDFHFNHYNIIKYCNRPFSSVEEMNEKLINNFNSMVKNNDKTYILGDFSMKGSYQEISSIMKSLNGEKIFILGNHDKLKNIQQMIIDKLIIYCGSTLGDSINSKYIWMSHYAHRVWDRSHRGSWHIFGHSHGALPSCGLSYDVGVDNNNYYPVSFEQLYEIMKKIN